MTKFLGVDSDGSQRGPYRAVEDQFGDPALRPAENSGLALEDSLARTIDISGFSQDTIDTIHAIFDGQDSQ